MNAARQMFAMTAPSSLLATIRVVTCTLAPNNTGDASVGPVAVHQQQVGQERKLRDGKV